MALFEIQIGANRVPNFEQQPSMYVAFATVRNEQKNNQ